MYEFHTKSTNTLLTRSIIAVMLERIAISLISRAISHAALEVVNTQNNLCYEYYAYVSGPAIYWKLPLKISVSPYSRVTLKVSTAADDLFELYINDGGYSSTDSIDFTNCGSEAVSIVLSINNLNGLYGIYFNVDVNEYQTKRSKLCQDPEAVSDAYLAIRMSNAIYSFEDTAKFKLDSSHDFTYSQQCRPFVLERLTERFYDFGGITNYHFALWQSEDVSVIVFEGLSSGTPSSNF